VNAGGNRGKARDYYKSKVMEWNTKPQGFESYIRNEKENNIKNEFEADKGNISNDFNDVCEFISKTYQSYQKTPSIASMMSNEDIVSSGLDEISILRGLANISVDIFDILIAATIKACGLNSPEMIKMVKIAIEEIILGGIELSRKIK
jgi:hypothetical protein